MKFMSDISTSWRYPLTHPPPIHPSNGDLCLCLPSDSVCGIHKSWSWVEL